MKKPLKLKTPLTEKDIEKLKTGDRVLLSGDLYTARDMAHKRMAEVIGSKEFPFDIKGQVIFYAGPAPAKPGKVTGPIGPTTSYRMDAYTPVLLKHGLKGMVGKGQRSEAVRNAMKKHRSVYFAAVGGTAALIAKSVKKVDIVAYGDLLAEAVRKLEVKDFPLIVVNDIRGNDLYRDGIKKYRKNKGGE